MLALLSILMLMQADPQAWFSLPVLVDDNPLRGPANYPERGFQSDKVGTTKVELFIGEDGKQQYCYIVASSGDITFDNDICFMAMEKINFKPALDKLHRPMSDIYRLEVNKASVERFRGKPAPPDVTLSVKKLPGSVTSAIVSVRYLVDDHGKIEDCQVQRSSGIPMLDAAACRAMPARFTFAPAKDKAGKAWPVVRRQEIGFEVADVQPATTKSP